MKKLLILITILGTGISLPCVAQQYFNLRDPFNGLFAVLTSVVEQNGKYYTAGPVIDSSNYQGNNLWYMVEGVKFAVFDKQGRKLIDTFYQQKFSRNIDGFFGKLTPYHNTLLLPVRTVDTSGNSHLMIIRFDTLGSVRWYKEYDKPMCASQDFWQIVDLQPDNYGNWLMLSTIFCQPNPTGGFGKMLLTKLDSSFNVIWHKDYGDAINNSIGGKLLIEPNGYLVCGGFTNNNLVQEHFIYRAEIFKTDTAGTVQWHWLSDASKYTHIIRDIIRTKDGDLVYSGKGSGVEVPYETPGIAGMIWLPWIEKITSSGNTVWNNTISPIYTGELTSGINVLAELQHGDIAGAGQMWGFTGKDTAYHNTGALVRLRPDGTIKWKHTYTTIQNDSFRYAIYDMKPTSDGGYIMCGEATDEISPISNPVQRGWLIKVDSNGCQSTNDPQCWLVNVPSSPKLNKAAYTVYPNPATEQLHISYANQNTETALVTLYDITGRTLLTRSLTGKSGYAILDIRHLQGGVYLYRITSSSGIEQQGKLERQ